MNENFTQTELEVIKKYAVKQSVFSAFSFYICLLLAPIAFASYGLFNNDALAIFIAFAGLLVFIMWYLVSSNKYETVFNSIFTKILKEMDDS